MVKARDLEPQTFSKLLPVFLIQLGDFRFQIPTYNNHAASLFLGELPHPLNIVTIFFELSFIHIGHIENWLGREEAKLVEESPLVSTIYQANGLFSLIEHFPNLIVKFQYLRLFLVPDFRHPPHFSPPPLQNLQVAQYELRFHHLDIPSWIDGAIFMGDIFVVKTPNDMGYCVHIADMTEELISQALPFVRPPYQSSNIEEFQRRRDHLLGMDEIGDVGQPFVRHLNDPDIGLNGCKPVRGHLSSGSGKPVEDGGLSHVRQANDAASKSHWHLLH